MWQAGDPVWRLVQSAGVYTGALTDLECVLFDSSAADGEGYGEPVLVGTAGGCIIGMCCGRKESCAECAMLLDGAETVRDTEQ